MKPPVKKNLTLSLPAELIGSAKVLAAKRGTSINALVKESLEELVRLEDEQAAALRRILSTSRKGLYRLKLKSGKFSRAELYA